MLLLQKKCQSINKLKDQGVEKLDRLKCRTANIFYAGK